MQTPADLAKITLHEASKGPYPPVGFVPFSEGELGNGDYYGLYWSIGRETDEPIICDMLHDEWRIEPCFSSLSACWPWLESNDGFRGDDEPEPEPDFGIEKFRQAGACLKENAVPQAIALLCEAVESVPDVSAWWTLLGSQYFRERNTGSAVEAAIGAYCANWAFGRPPQQALGLLARAAKSAPDSNDPVLNRVGLFDLSFGGNKQNDNYDIMQLCIQDYFQSDKPNLGLQLHHNYAYMMQGETTAFQQRYVFDLQQWQDEHAELCLKYLGDDRKFRPG